MIGVIRWFRFKQFSRLNFFHHNSPYKNLLKKLNNSQDSIKVDRRSIRAGPGEHGGVSNLMICLVVFTASVFLSWLHSREDTASLWVVVEWYTTLVLRRKLEKMRGEMRKRKIKGMCPSWDHLTTGLGLGNRKGYGENLQQMPGPGLDTGALASSPPPAPFLAASWWEEIGTLPVLWDLGEFPMTMHPCNT